MGADPISGGTGRPPRADGPRDELGRPLPWDAPTRLQLEDFLSLTWEENHELGVRYFNSGEYFAAHEAWEAAWKQNRNGPEAEFFKGLAQLGAGYVHLLRGNPHGAMTLLERASSRLSVYPDSHLGVDCRNISERCRSDAAAVSSGALVPGPEALSGLPSGGYPAV